MFSQKCTGTNALVVMLLLLLVLVGTATAATVNLAWDPNTDPDIAKYRIYRGTSQGGPYTQIGEVIHPTVTFPDATAQDGATYYYVGTALDGFDNESIYSNEVSTTIVPAVPSAVAAGDGGAEDRVTVSWGDVSGETGYRVYRSATSGGTYTQIGTTAANATSYDDTLPCGGTVNFYKVSAVNAGGESAMSTADAGSTGACAAPPAPQNVAASDGTSLDFVTVTWSASTGADDYRVLRSDSVGSTKSPLSGWLTGLSWQDTSGTPGTTYHYWVTARNAGGESGYGGPDTGFRALPAEVVSTPDAPSGPATGYTTLSYSFTASGGSSSHGHNLQYRFDWGDGTQSNWLPEGTVTTSKSWGGEGTFNVRVMARCVDDTAVDSSWSTSLSVNISIDGSAPAAPGNLTISSL